MNYSRRQRLKAAVKKLDDAYWILSGVVDDEQDALDNTPENMQDGYRYQDREEYLEGLQDLVEDLDSLRGKFANKA